MAKIEFRQDVLAPNREWVADFKNVHRPTLLLGEMGEIAKWNWRVTSSNVFTDEVKWDVTSDPIGWFGEWRFRDKKDLRTLVWIRVICQGEYDKKTQMGSVNVKVKPTMVTTFKWENPVMGMLYWFYFKTFYRQILLRYLTESQEKVRSFDAVLREKLGLKPPNVQERVSRRPK